MLLAPEHELNLFLDIISAEKQCMKPPCPQEKRLTVFRHIAEAAGYVIVTSKIGTVYSPSHRTNKRTGVHICTYEGNIEPTLWLEALYCKFMGELSDNDRESVLAKLRMQLLNTVAPFKPVVVTEFGDRIFEWPSEDFVHFGEDTSLDSTFYHGICGQRVDFCRISDSHNALTCSRCYLRVPIPKSLISIGDLRHHFFHLQPPWQI